MAGPTEDVDAGTAPAFAVRPARHDDRELARLQEIELLAGRLFLDVGMPEIAGDDPPTVAELAGAAALLVVVRTADDQPVGYARIEVVDHHAHLEQLSVDPTSGRLGLGTALLDAVAGWARVRGDTELTLTTFRDVPFNRPYYERRGFEIVADDDRGPGLVALMAEEAEHGLDPVTHVAMRRPLDG